MTESRTELPVRAALVVLALAIAVWMGIGLRAARSEAEWREMAPGQLDEETFRRSLELLRDAKRGNPDTGPRLVEGALLVARGRLREGVRVIEEVVREEPENATAWALLAGATSRYDPRREAEARAALARLKPSLPR